MGKIETLLKLMKMMKGIVSDIEKEAGDLKDDQIEEIMASIMVIGASVEQVRTTLLVEQTMRRRANPKSSEEDKKGSEKPAEDCASKVETEAIPESSEEDKSGSEKPAEDREVEVFLEDTGK